MKKYRNSKKQADRKGTEKQPDVGSVLLHTYFTSLLSLVLCVCMFMGTSYAWFTSEITNTANEIYVGILDVALYKENKVQIAATESEPAGERVELQNLANTDIKLFNNGIRWEPGYTALETIQIVNKGDLAFKYDLFFTDGVLQEGATQSLEDVAKYFDVCVFDHYNKTYTAPTSYEDILASGDWEKVGTLADVLSGKCVLAGNMVTVREAIRKRQRLIPARPMVLLLQTDIPLLCT